MSAVPRRKPVPVSTTQELSSTSQHDTAIPTHLDVAQESSSVPDDSSALESDSGEYPIPDGETLVLSKQKVEQLAYLLLDLVGNSSGGRYVPQRQRDSLRDAASLFQPTSSNLLKPKEKLSAVTVQEILQPNNIGSDQVSQELLQRRPWSHERVNVAVLDPDAVEDDNDLQLGESPTLVLHGVENVRLLPMGRPAGSSRVLKENSLYMLQHNHAWTDLHTNLGPGKLTDEGQSWWLARRAPRSWPITVPVRKRADHLKDLWHTMTINCPTSRSRHDILSNLATESESSRMYKQVLGRRLLRQNTSGSTEVTHRPRIGIVRQVTSTAHAISRTLFSLTDSARARLPSTQFLRMIGQVLFVECLSVDRDDHGETLLQILTASLKIIEKHSKDPRTARQTPNINTRPTVLISQEQNTEVEVTVWMLLSACYHASILHQPAVGNDGILRDHISGLFSALQLVNMFTSRYDDRQLRSMDLDTLLSSHIRSICPQATLRKTESIYPAIGSEYFGKKELNVRTLQNIGALNIMWTRCIDDHLTFDTDTGEVRIFWPAWALANLPCAGLFSPRPISEILQDLLATYSFLFYSPGGFDAAVREYDNLDPPTWLGTMNYTTMADLTKHRTLIGDTRYHFAAYERTPAQMQFGYTANDNKTMIRFDTCGMFENRVRILKSYMDSQKPSGLLALWRDKRDSGQWYTFWLVLIIGGASLFLGLVSLGVTIAQTVASFEALKYQAASLGIGNSSNITATASSSTASATTNGTSTSKAAAPRITGVGGFVGAGLVGLAALI